MLHNLFDTPSRNIAIDPPDPSEYIPIFEYLKPKLSSPITDTFALSFATTFYEFILLVFFFHLSM